MIAFAAALHQSAIEPSRTPEPCERDDADGANGTATHSPNSIFAQLDGLLAAEVELCVAVAFIEELGALRRFLADRQAASGPAAAGKIPNSASAAKAPSTPECAHSTSQANDRRPVARETRTPETNPAGSSTAPLPEHIRYRAEISAAARRHGLDPVLLAAVAAQETGGPGSDSGNNVVGADGTGHGVFQIDSGTWNTWLVAHHDGLNVAENADKAASILADDLRSAGGDVRGALHLYNAGSAARPSTVTQWPDGRTLDYEDSVLVHYDALRRENA